MRYRSNTVIHPAMWICFPSRTLHTAHRTPHICHLPQPSQIFIHGSVEHQHIIKMYVAFQEGDKVVIVQV